MLVNVCYKKEFGKGRNALFGTALTAILCLLLCIGAVLTAESSKEEKEQKVELHDRISYEQRPAQPQIPQFDPEKSGNQTQPKIPDQNLPNQYRPGISQYPNYGNAILPPQSNTPDQNLPNQYRPGMPQYPKYGNAKLPPQSNTLDQNLPNQYRPGMPQYPEFGNAMLPPQSNTLDQNLPNQYRQGMPQYPEFGNAMLPPQSNILENGQDISPTQNPTLWQGSPYQSYPPWSQFSTLPQQQYTQTRPIGYPTVFIIRPSQYYQYRSFKPLLIRRK